jgi:hypothetical protein
MNIEQRLAEAIQSLSPARSPARPRSTSAPTSSSPSSPATARRGHRAIHRCGLRLPGPGHLVPRRAGRTGCPATTGEACGVLRWLTDVPAVWWRERHHSAELPEAYIRGLAVTGAATYAWRIRPARMPRRVVNRQAGAGSLPRPGRLTGSPVPADQSGVHRRISERRDRRRGRPAAPPRREAKSRNISNCPL